MILAIPRNKTKLSQNTCRTWEINAGEKSSQISSSRNRSVRIWSKDVSNASILQNDRSSCTTSKAKRENVIWFLEYAKGNNFRFREEREISWQAFPCGGRALAYPRVSLSEKSTAADEKLISRCDAHKLIFTSKRWYAYISIAKWTHGFANGKLTDVTIARAKSFRRFFVEKSKRLVKII